MKYLWSFSAAVGRRLKSFQQFVQCYNAMQCNALHCIAAPSNLFTMFKSIRSKVNMQLQIQGVKTTERQIQIRKQYNGKTITNGIVIHNSDGRQMSNDKV